MIGVGEYVRTKKGIFKILGIKTVQTKMNGNHDLAYLIDDCPLMYIIDNNFIKHSKNIIDLIEVGDILKIKSDNEITTVGFDDDYTGFYEELKDHIKRGEMKLISIVTKEQFESIEYKV